MTDPTPASAFPFDDQIMQAPLEAAASLKPWTLMDNLGDRKVLYKAGEEAAELMQELALLQKVIFRCLHQGLDEFDPASGVYNRDALQKELGDVRGMSKVLIDRLKLDNDYIRSRAKNKALFVSSLTERT